MDRLFTRSYVCILSANFLLYFGFWLLVPILPFYLRESYGCPEAVMGIVLSCYAISGLCIRPFSGYILDKFPRKPIYILCYVICASMFVGYVVAFSILFFVALRIVHGLAFGGVTVGGNTLCVDIMPSSRRGEGLGYYGLTNNAAMALGPMTGLFMHGHIPFGGIFLAGLLFSIAGLCCALCVKTKRKPSMAMGLSTPDFDLRSKFGCTRHSSNKLGSVLVGTHLQLNLDRFILLKAIPVSISLLMLSIPYGCTTNYVAVYAQEIGLQCPTGFFFTLMAVGMGVARIAAGKRVDKGYITQCIHYGFYPVVVAFLLLGLCRFIPVEWAVLVFYLVPTMLGIGFGVMFPAMNTLYINLAPNNRRATATGTYLTAWDVGLAIGIFTGGVIAHYFTYYMVYVIGSVICLLSMLYFNGKVTPHYYKNRLR